MKRKLSFLIVAILMPTTHLIAATPSSSFSFPLTDSKNTPALAFPVFHETEDTSPATDVNVRSDAFPAFSSAKVIEKPQTPVSEPEPKSPIIPPIVTTKTVRVPVAGTGWAARPICNNPGCPMCYVQYTNKTETIKLANPLANAPTKDRDKALSLLKLKQSDVFADIGCGNGTVLIEAVKRYGVKSAIGIEIDPNKVKQARQNVKIAGLESRIKIVEGDAKKFKPSDYGITAIYTFLYPDLLKSIDFREIERIVSVYHDLPSLNTEKIGNVYIFQPKTQEIAMAIPRSGTIPERPETPKPKVTGHWEKRCVTDKRGKVVSCQMVWVAH